MDFYELTRGERFLIDTMNEFRFLNNYNYNLIKFCTMGGEYYATYTHYFSARNITILFNDKSGFDVIFRKETSEEATDKVFSNMTRMKKYPTSIEELAEIIQTFYMYLVIPYK